MSIQKLMRHRMDVYSPGYGQDTSGRTMLTFTLVSEAVPCNVQPATSEVVAQYNSRDERVSHTIYWTDATITVGIKDRIVFEDVSYRIVGLKRDTQKGLWYRADVEAIVQDEGVVSALTYMPPQWWSATPSDEPLQTLQAQSTPSPEKPAQINVRVVNQFEGRALDEFLRRQQGGR